MFPVRWRQDAASFQVSIHGVENGVTRPGTDLEIGDDARVLYTLNRLRAQNTRQVRIRSKPLPVPAAKSSPPQWTSHRAQGNIRCNITSASQQNSSRRARVGGEVEVTHLP